MKKNFLKLFVVAATFFICTTANAMTGIEFMKLSSGSEEKAALEPLVVEYVSQGYKNVPNWAELSRFVNDAIRKNGWGNKDLRDIAISAAKEKGMTK